MDCSSVTCDCPHASWCRGGIFCYCDHDPQRCAGIRQVPSDAEVCCTICQKERVDTRAGALYCMSCYTAIQLQCPSQSNCRLFPKGMCTMMHGLTDDRPRCSCGRFRNREHSHCWYCFERRKKIFAQHPCKYTSNCRYGEECMNMHGIHDPRPICGGCDSMTDGRELCRICANQRALLTK